MPLEKINYIELPSTNLAATKAFFTQVFAWEFADYGPEYTAFSNAGLDGGFYASDTPACTEQGSALVVLLSDDLEATQERVVAAGGVIAKAIFSFPGGRRFQFIEPGGSELAVWALEPS